MAAPFQASTGGWSDVVRKQPILKPQEGISNRIDETFKSSEGVSIAVVDANAIIQGGDKLHDITKKFVSVAEVLQEVKDPAARHRLACLPFPVETMDPSTEAIKKVVSFARDTGDLQTLSDVDIKLIALTYTLEAQVHGTSHLRERPLPLHMVRVKRLPENEMPGWGSNVPNMEEWEALENAVEAPSNFCSRILPLKDLSLNVTPSDEHGCDAEDITVASGESQSASQEVQDFHSTNADRYSRSNSEINIKEKKMVADGIDASKGEADENSAEWKPSVSRSTHRRYLKRQARRAQSRSSEHDYFEKEANINGNLVIATEENLYDTCNDNRYGAFLNNERSNEEEGSEYNFRNENATPESICESGEFDPSRFIKDVREPNALPEFVEHSDDAVHISGVCVKDDILEDIGKLKLVEDDAEPEADTFHHFEISNPSDIGVGKTELDDCSSEQSWTLQPMSDSSVACVTSDFAMQNVILQMGLRLVAASGVQIRKLHRWVLKCHACQRVTAEIGRIFCPKCGNGGTLRRVSVTIDGNGIIQTSGRPRISVRGTRFSLPPPQGGRDAITKNPILREDQLPHKLLYPKTKKKQGNQGVDVLTADEFTFHRSDRREPLKPPVRKALSVFSGKRNPNDNHFSRHKH